MAIKSGAISLCALRSGQEGTVLPIKKATAPGTGYVSSG